jgi:hypothetical protein
LVLLLSGRLLFLALLADHTHLVGQQAIVRIVDLFHLKIVVGFLLHGLIAPVDPKLGDSRFIGKDGSTRMFDQSFDGCVGAFLLKEVLSKDVVNIIAYPYELLFLVANR